MRLRLHVGTIQIIHRDNAEEVIHPHTLKVDADLAASEGEITSALLDRLPEVLEDLSGVVLMSWNDADLEYVMQHLNDSFAFVHTLEDVSLGGLTRLLRDRLDRIATGLSAGRVRCLSVTLQQDQSLSVCCEREETV